MTNRVATKLYLFQKNESENINKNPKRTTIIWPLQSNWVQESIMQEESINTPHICLTQREPFS